MQGPGTPQVSGSTGVPNHQSGVLDLENCAGRTNHNVLLVGQTDSGNAWLLEGVPTRPSQNNPQRVAQWERWRQRVGGNIRDLRTARGMTQEALALESGVTRNVLIDVEHGRRGLLYERLFDIAEALEVPVAELLASED